MTFNAEAYMQARDDRLREISQIEVSFALNGKRHSPLTQREQVTLDQIRQKRANNAQQ